MAMAEAERARSELSTAKAREEKMANDMARLAIELEESRQVSSKHSSIAQRIAIAQSTAIAQHSKALTCLPSAALAKQSAKRTREELVSLERQRSNDAVAAAEELAGAKALSVELSARMERAEAAAVAVRGAQQ